MEKTRVIRFEELDLLRGIAIVSMLVLHFFEDWLFIKGNQILDPVFQSIWQRGTAVLFLLLFGVGAHLSYSRAYPGSKPKFARWLRKGAVLFGWGMLITGVTRLFLKEGFVVFGILHLMGAGSVLLYPLLAYKYRNLILGVLIILVGNYLDGLRFSFVCLFWLGLIPGGFNSVDYFPVVPWFGYILIGLYLGKELYPEGTARFNRNWSLRNPFWGGLSLLGRNSLLIYMVHQPLLLAVIYLAV